MSRIMAVERRSTAAKNTTATRTWKREGKKKGVSKPNPYVDDKKKSDELRIKQKRTYQYSSTPASFSSSSAARPLLPPLPRLAHLHPARSRHHHHHHHPAGRSHLLAQILVQDADGATARLRRRTHYPENQRREGSRIAGEGFDCPRRGRGRRRDRSRCGRRSGCRSARGRVCAGDGRLRACVRVSAGEGGEEGGMRTPRATGAGARVREGAEGVTFGADFDFGFAYDFGSFEREDGHASALSRAAPASASAREQEQGGHSTASTRRATQALARVSGRVATRAPAPARTRRAPGTGARAARAGTAGARAAGSTAAAAVCAAMMSFSPSSSRAEAEAEAEVGAGGRDAGGGSTAARVRACVAARAEAAMPVPVPVVLVRAAGPVLRAHVSCRAHALPVLLRLPRRRWRRAGGAAGARGAAGM